jgi:hypothetical protein
MDKRTNPCFQSGFDAALLRNLSKIEVVSKFQIRFKGPAKRDYISNLKKIKVCIKRQAERESAVPPTAG